MKGWGAQVLSSATSLDEALWLEAHGADAVIAQGLEAGGDRGHFLRADLDVATQMGTFALLPQVVRALKVPVIAAGGIAHAQGVAAALALGAAAVQVGTAYLLCLESSTSAVHQAALQSADATTTALTNLFTGRPARGIVNRVMRELGPMSSQAPAFPLAAAAIAPLRAQAEARNSGDFSPLWTGQNARWLPRHPRRADDARTCRRIASFAEDLMTMGIVHHITHPLVQHKLTLMRQKDLSTSSFRRLMHEISMLMAYEVTRDMPTQLIDIETPLETCRRP